MRQSVELFIVAQNAMWNFPPSIKVHPWTKWLSMNNFISEAPNRKKTKFLFLTRAKLQKSVEKDLLQTVVQAKKTTTRPFP